jgi:hypothetical protein
LAVGAHGYPRATHVVDLLVGNEAFEHHSGLVTLKPEVPIEIEGVSVDLLSTNDEEDFVEQSLEHPGSGEVPVVAAETLIYLKLKSPRFKTAPTSSSCSRPASRSRVCAGTSSGTRPTSPPVSRSAWPGPEPRRSDTSTAAGRAWPRLSFAYCSVTTRGLCEDVLCTVLTEHELVVAERVLIELERGLVGKLRMPARQARVVVAFSRSFTLTACSRRSRKGSSSAS